LIAKLRNGGEATEYNGFGTCYVEFGGGRIGTVEVDFFLVRRRRESTTSRRSICALKRSFSVPVAAPAGSVSDVSVPTAPDHIPEAPRTKISGPVSSRCR